ncbi:TonB-dependent receptor [Thalassotalea aquiviva]|uniref:TonB-dependent receptor n=1 Tax=Thalassotalea aquiviva TaxID=3242415 RepID=UPI00352B24D4
MAKSMAWGLALLPLAISSSLAAQTVIGVVFDVNGKPLKSVKVKIKNKSVFTDVNGQFVFKQLDDKAHEVHFSAPGYSHISKQVNANDTTPLNVTLSQSSIEILDVYATPLHASTIESAQPVNVLVADELRSKQASTLGDTLKGEVGVHSTSYGNVSSSPVIRGMDGPRVLVTQNGLDVGDASRVGPDHIVSGEASTATQIEVLRGPSTLFYGSGAIGGVVNVVDERVPTHNDTLVNYLLAHESVNDQNSASLNLNTGKGKFALHLDGFWRQSNDVNIPGYAENQHDLHDEDHEDEHEDEHEEELSDEHESEHDDEKKGVIENTAAKASGFNIGTSYLLDNGYVGVSYGRLARQYGIPGHAHGEDAHDSHQEDVNPIEGEEHSDDSVSGDLTQNRYQMLSALSYENDFINQINTKLAFTDYQHQEIEDGVVGTVFKNKMMEARADFYHHEVNGWTGAWTAHYKSNDFEAIGDEAFTPPSKTDAMALVWLEEKHFGDFLWQLGARIEHVKITVEDSHDDADSHDEHDEDIDLDEIKSQSFTPLSLSAGTVWDYQQGYNLAFSLSYSQRAPSAAELFANGPHIGTNTYEIGAIFDVEAHQGHADIGLNSQKVDLETSYNIDLTWRKFEGNFGFVFSAFYNHIDDYYYQQNTALFANNGHQHDEGILDEFLLEEEEGLPIYQFQQADVDMYGFEAELAYQISEPLKATLIADYIRAKLTDGGNLPRIPPMRIGSELTYQQDNYAISSTLSHYFKQNDVADLETSTKGYTMLDAKADFYLDGFGDDFVIFVKAQNLTNEEARVHGSFLKDTAPLPGRNFSVGIRGSF